MKKPTYYPLEDVFKLLNSYTFIFSPRETGKKIYYLKRKKKQK